MNSIIYILIFIISQPRIFFLLTHPHKTIKISVADICKSILIFIFIIYIISYITKHYELYSNLDETHCKYVSSRGLLKSCDVKPNNPVSSVTELYDYNWESLKPNSTVYVHGSAIPAFVQHAFNKIKVPFVLVSGDCDETIASDVLLSEESFKTFIEDPKLLHWFSQNAVTKHPKLTTMPIGMAYHGMYRNSDIVHDTDPVTIEKTLIDIREAGINKPKKMKCYGNFHFLMNTRYSSDRHDAKVKIPESCIDYETDRISSFDTWRKQMEYNFVVSPHGNGYDCHRTWEALILGIIPIVKTSEIDNVFEKLPVVIVKDWSEITPEFLQSEYDKIQSNKQNGLYDMNKLTLKYWVNKIRNATTV